MLPKFFIFQLQSGIALLCITFSSLAYSTTLIDDDWFFSSNLCSGCYKQAQLPKKPDKLVEIQASQASLSTQGISELSGNVQGYYGAIALKAKRAQVHRSDRQFKYIHLHEQVNLMQQDFRLAAKSISIHIPSKYMQLNQLEYRLYNKHARGSGARAELYDQNLLIVTNGNYTTCAPLQDTWLIQANKFVVDRDKGMAQAHHAKLYVKNVPIFYWPYLSLPVDKQRKTGLLQPAVGSSSKHGKTLSVPIYFNLATNYDLTTNAQFFSKHGFKLDNEFRYINEYIKKLNVQYDFLPNDKASNKYRSRIKVLNNTNFTNDFKLNVDYANASDKNYYDDFQPEVANTVYALQQADLNYVTDDYALTTEVRQYRTFHSSNNVPIMAQYRKLPEVSLQVFPHLAQNFLISGKMQYTNFQNFSRDTLPTANRYYGQLHIAHDQYFNGVQIKPSVRINYQGYRYQDVNKNLNAQYLTPIFDFHSNLSFTRRTSNGTSQILQPKMYYVYIPKVKANKNAVFDTKRANFNYQQLFSYSNYDGIDLIDRSNQVSMALETRTLWPDNQESLIGMGARYNFLDKKFSPLAATYHYYFNEKTSLLTDVVFNNLFSVNLQHKLANNHVFNVGYAYDQQLPLLPLHQVNLSAAIPVNDNLVSLGKMEYDFKNKRVVNTALGFEYQTCCLAFRVLAERIWQANMPHVHKYDNQFKFQIIFKGLAGLGNADNKHMAELVPGYSYQDKF